MQDDRIKNLRIKTNVLKRIDKELKYYFSEANQQRDQLQSVPKDRVSRQEQLLNETLMVIPDCQKRLLNAYNDLKNLLTESSDLSECEVYRAAKSLFDSIEPQSLEV